MRPGLATDRYTSAEWLEREKRTVFRRTWLAAARDSELPRPGDCLPFDELGESLILVRGPDGTARAFRNSCRHRGTRLLCGRRHTDRLTCPYHGWQYDLEGRLTRVPDVEGFGAFERRDHGLIPIRAGSNAGLVWITFDEQAPPLREFLGVVAEQLVPYRLEQMRAIARKTWIVPCNWKAFIDNNSERYHVAAVHSSWSAALAVERVTFHDLGIHHLFSVSLANYRWRALLDRLTMPRGSRVVPAQGMLYQRYLIFPNTLVSVTPHQATVFRVFPLAADRCRVEYEFLVPGDAPLLGRLRGRAMWLASMSIVKEDNGILGLLQRGLAGPPRRIPLHREEIALAHFHRVVDRYVDRES